MSKSKLNTTIVLTSAAAAVADGEVVLTLGTEDKAFKKQEEAYTKAAEYRGNLVGAIATTVATEAKTQFENEEVDLVTGSMNFGPTELSATVYRTFQPEGSEESINNHVVIGSVDDYTTIVNEATDGIFEEEAETEEA